MDYDKLYEASTQELNKLKQDKAVLESKINEYSRDLGVPPTLEAIQKKITELEKEKDQLEAQLTKLVGSLEESDSSVEPEATPIPDEDNEF